MISNTRALLYLYIASFLWSLTTPLGKYISLEAVSLIWWRILICTLILLPFILKNLIFLYRSNKHVFKKIIRSGILIALHWVTFYESAKLANISIATICLASTSFFVCFVDALLYKKKIRAIQIIQSILILLSFGLIYKTGETENIKIGLLIGIIATIFNAFYLSMNERIMKEEVNATSVVGLQFTTTTLLISLIFILLYFIPITTIFPNTPKNISQIFDFTILEKHDIIPMLIFAIICTVIPFNLVMASYKKISAFTQSIILNMEPVLSIAIGMFIFREFEELNIGFYISISIIIALIGFETYQSAKKK